MTESLNKAKRNGYRASICVLAESTDRSRSAMPTSTSNSDEMVLTADRALCLLSADTIINTWLAYSAVCCSCSSLTKGFWSYFGNNAMILVSTAVCFNAAKIQITRIIMAQTRAPNLKFIFIFAAIYQT